MGPGANARLYLACGVTAAEIGEIAGLLSSPISPIPTGFRLLGVTLSSLDAADEGRESQLAFAL